MNAKVPRTVIIDCFPENVARYRDEGYVVVAIDVIRATTTAVTAAAMGRKCYPVDTVDNALALAADLDNPLMVGELGGDMFSCPRRARRSSLQPKAARRAM